MYNAYFDEEEKFPSGKMMDEKETNNEAILEKMVEPSESQQNGQSTESLSLPLHKVTSTKETPTKKLPLHSSPIHPLQVPEMDLKQDLENPEIPKQPRVDSIPGMQDGSKGIYFKDDTRKVDFILVYSKTHANDILEKRRQFFLENIIKEGLEIEIDSSLDNARDDNVFIKVHAPWVTLCRQAELLKLKMPLKLQDTQMDDLKNISIYKMWKKYFFQARDNITGLKPNSMSVTWNFSRKKIDRFNITDKETFFTTIQRIELVWEVLQAAKNDPNDDKKRGVETLLEKHVYEAAFPPHDGDDEVPKDLSPSYWCQRQMLRATWASWGSMFKKQPLESIRKYFGEKISFYFAFLGFYTKWLFAPALGGILAFLYGVFYTGDDVVVADYCDETTEPGNFTMCPLCEPLHCEPFILAEGCSFAEWDYRMDNEATAVLAFLSVLWATAFIKMWKRHEAELAFEWDTYDLEMEDVVIRPEYEENAPERRENPVTRETEPFVPNSTRVFWLMISTLVTLFMLCSVVAVLSGLVMFRILLYRVLKTAGGSLGHHNVEFSRWICHGLIFIVVVIFEKIYHSIALKLTSWECPKTQAQWMTSFLWKVFLFELLNDFVPIAYAAWFKGKLTATPLDLDYKQELCDPGGCLFEVFELVAVLLVARLVVGNTMEVGIPFLQNLIARCWQEKRPKSAAEASQTRKVIHQYQKDFHLNELELDGVAEEYMEMIVQFAFVTLFVPVFPMAPAVCFLNNLAEVRVDAINFVVAHRRPLPIRVPGIQIWNEFLDVITKLAILVNACLIAFTSDLVPRLYYKYYVKSDQTLDGYGEFSLSKIEMEGFGIKIEEYLEHNPNSTYCYYQDFRLPEPPYELTETFWKIMLLRVSTFAAFVVVFFTYHWLFNFLVSDIPSHVKMNIRRRKFVITRATETEVVYDRWLKKANKKPKSAQSDAKTSLTRISDQQLPIEIGSENSVVDDHQKRSVTSISKF